MTNPIISNFVDRLSTDQTKELIMYALDQLTDLDAVDTLKAWTSEKEFEFVENLVSEIEP